MVQKKSADRHSIAAMRAGIVRCFAFFKVKPPYVMV
jgi:hypothetical protein